MPKTIEERFWSKVDKRASDECWSWTASLYRNGYGQFSDKTKKLLAHKWSYERFVGPVPDGKEIDHLCRNRRCVNPAHLEAVPHRVNMGRGETIAALAASRTHCPHGHPYDAENTDYEKDGSRKCRMCRRKRDRDSKRWLHMTPAQREAARAKWKRYRERKKAAHAGPPSGGPGGRALTAVEPGGNSGGAGSGAGAPPTDPGGGGGPSPSPPAPSGPG